MTVAKLVARAEEELAAARLLAGGGFTAKAVSRAYSQPAVDLARFFG